MYRRSETSLRDLIARESQGSVASGGYIDLPQHSRGRRKEGQEAESPSWSGESDYSSSYSPVDASGSTSRPVQVWNTGRDGPEDSSSGSTARKDDTRFPQYTQHERTPTSGSTDPRPEVRPVGFSYSSDSLHATPIVSQTQFTRSHASPSRYTPTSGRLGTPQRSEKGSPADVEQPQSAPPWQGDFGSVGVRPGEGEQEDEPTVKGRGRDKRATLPLPVDKGDYPTPEKPRAGGSPQPPPRSALRTQ